MKLDSETVFFIRRSLTLLAVAVPAIVYGIHHHKTRKMVITFLTFVLLLPVIALLVLIACLVLTPVGGAAVGIALAFCSITLLRKVWGGTITVYEPENAS